MNVLPTISSNELNPTSECNNIGVLQICDPSKTVALATDIRLLKPKISEDGGAKLGLSENLLPSANLTLLRFGVS